MRIERIDIDGYGSLSGSFTFPEGALGLWCAPNDTGKSSFATAVGAALYGPPPSGSAEPASGWIMVRLVTDQGVPLVVARDLTAGTVQITDATGHDITESYQDVDEGIGEQILGMTREEFREVTRNDLESVRETIGNRILRSLLGNGRGRFDRNGVRNGTGPAGASPPAGPDAEEMRIFRSAAEELGYAAPEAESSEIDPATGAPAAPADPAASAPPDLTTLAAETNDNVRLRRMRDALRTLEQRFTTAQDEYRAWNLRQQELQVESDRLGALAGAEPGDVAKLDQLLDLLGKIQSRRDKLRLEEEAFRSDLASRGTADTDLQELDALIRGLEEEERTFLESFRQSETVLRGNQALVRSESRLDETQLQEIERARRDAARMATGPLVVSILGLFGSVLLHVLPWLPLPPVLFLALGLLGATAGAWLLWRAKHLREEERVALEQTQNRKNDQMTAFDEQESEAMARLAALAASVGVEPPLALVDRNQEWLDRKPEIRRLDALARRTEEIERELVTVREKLGSFAPTESPDIDPEDLAVILADYQRYFQVQEELSRADQKGTEYEELLTDLEREQAAFRERLVEELQQAGVDADRDLDEAIEIHGMRAGNGIGAPDAAGTPPEASASSPGVPAEVAPPAPFDAGSTDWTATVSTRAEEIARQLLPDIRELEVDPELTPHVRFAESSPRLSWDELRPRLSAAAQDQLCLALRLAIVETVSSVGERIPVLLDDPLLRADDERHARAMQFLVEDAGARGQVVLLTAHEVRTRWFLHQNPSLKDRVRSLRDEDPSASPISSPVSSPSS